jgi:hypothetical protein
MHIILPRLLRAFHQARQQHDRLPRLPRLINELKDGGTLQTALVVYRAAHRINSHNNMAARVSHGHDGWHKSCCHTWAC